jgi:hypothetical protein
MWVDFYSSLLSICVTSSNISNFQSNCVRKSVEILVKTENPWFPLYLSNFSESSDWAPIPLHLTYSVSCHLWTAFWLFCIYFWLFLLVNIFLCWFIPPPPGFSKPCRYSLVSGGLHKKKYLKWPPNFDLTQMLGVFPLLLLCFWCKYLQLFILYNHYKLCG